MDARRLAFQLLVDQLYMEFPYYGMRRVSLHLQRVGRDLARSLMAAVNLRTVYPGTRTSKPQPGHRIYPYLLANLEQILPGEVICADITYIPVRVVLLGPATAQAHRRVRRQLQQQPTPLHVDATADSILAKVEHIGLLVSGAAH